ncbi:hypothetical protein, conserved [Eimeria brunetti]|uniref:Conserved oligomeric Golgi complex subunit 8 n=1 Tax=Eimeria brunetti TaxID=51314 RepID=U6LS43_9EIME|nr:hypothetical protein, conserved [Eimeria brunetti]
MAPSEQFWQLLLGGELASADSTNDSPQGSRKDETAQPRESSRTDANDEMFGATTHSTASSDKGYAQQDKAQLDTAKRLGIDDFLQMTSDDLCRQPALLHTQAEKLVNVQDELAVQNCSLFLASSKALSNLSSTISSLSATLAEMEHCIQPLHSCLKLFELPSLVFKCSNGGLYDEAVDVMMLAEERIASLRASGCCGMPLLDFLEMQGEVHLIAIVRKIAFLCIGQMKEARNSCVKTMLRQLGQHVQLSPSMKLVGPLRRLSCSEEQLKTQYLRRRDGEISRQRRNAEGSCETDPARGLCAASELLRVDVLQTAINYRAIFGSTDGRLSAWLSEQVHWFVKLVEKELLRRSGLADSDSEDFTGTRPSLNLAAVEAAITQTNLRSASKSRVGLLDLATIFRQVHNAASAFRRVQCYFFPLVALIFDRYVIAVHRQRLEDIAVAFGRSIDEYNYVPSTAHLSLLGTSPWFQSDLSANRSCVFLLRHAPLSNLYNSILEVANAFQECPISTTAAGVVSLIESLLAFCIRKLNSVKPGRRENFEEDINAIEQSLVQKNDAREGSTTSPAEFFVLCDIFATVLLPAVAKQLSSTFPPHTDLDIAVLQSLLANADLWHSPNPFTEASSTSDGQATGDDTPTNVAPVAPEHGTVPHRSP